MIFSLDNIRKDGVDLSIARSSDEILAEADLKYSQAKGPTFEQITSKHNPEEIILISEYFSQIQDFTTLIDVRSPAEFNESHLPHAVNFPILDNYERREVGILYKERGKHIATQSALEFASPKLEALKNFIPKNSNCVIYCWRGGGRSAFVHGNLAKMGFEKVKRLRGGYKAYRRWVHNKLYNETYPKLIVVKGLTGVGKSELLRSVQRDFRILDLESCASHCASSFGSIPYELKRKYEIPSQKLFEDRIFAQLYLSKSPISTAGILVESESRKIGHRKMPPKLYDAMLQSTTIEIVASLESRVERIYQEYVGQDQAGVKLLHRDLEKIKRYLSTELYGQMKKSLNEGKIKSFISDCLINYYDRRYAGYYDKKNLLTIDNSIAENGKSQLTEFLK